MRAVDALAVGLQLVAPDCCGLVDEDGGQPASRRWPQGTARHAVPGRNPVVHGCSTLLHSGSREVRPRRSHAPPTMSDFVARLAVKGMMTCAGCRDAENKQPHTCGIDFALHEQERTSVGAAALATDKRKRHEVQLRSDTCGVADWAPPTAPRRRRPGGARAAGVWLRTPAGAYVQVAGSPRVPAATASASSSARCSACSTAARWSTAAGAPASATPTRRAPPRRRARRRATACSWCGASGRVFPTCEARNGSARRELRLDLAQLQRPRSSAAASTTAPSPPSHTASSRCARGSSPPRTTAHASVVVVASHAVGAMAPPPGAGAAAARRRSHVAQYGAAISLS